MSSRKYQGERDDPINPSERKISGDFTAPPYLQPNALGWNRGQGWSQLLPTPYCKKEAPEELNMWQGPTACVQPRKILGTRLCEHRAWFRIPVDPCADHSEGRRVIWGLSGSSWRPGCTLSLPGSCWCPQPAPHQLSLVSSIQECLGRDFPGVLHVHCRGHEFIPWVGN